MHGYAFMKARAAFGAFPAIIVAFFMLAMIFMPIIIFYLEKYGLDFVARPAAFAGYSWMGVLFLFCSSAASLDCYRLIIGGSGICSQRR
jgi:hypothetical protein